MKLNILIGDFLKNWGLFRTPLLKRVPAEEISPVVCFILITMASFAILNFEVTQLFNFMYKLQSVESSISHF